jgi:hypothetical protein
MRNAYLYKRHMLGVAGAQRGAHGQHGVSQHCISNESTLCEQGSRKDDREGPYQKLWASGSHPQAQQRDESTPRNSFSTCSSTATANTHAATSTQATRPKPSTPSCTRARSGNSTTSTRKTKSPRCWLLAEKSLGLFGPTEFGNSDLAHARQQVQRYSVNGSKLHSLGCHPADAFRCCSADDGRLVRENPLAGLTTLKVC